ncbi:hypothetical protein [Streptosporangium amethystogenes]|nr:hypothetical protein [Streptosporangium amethystogenes]
MLVALWDGLSRTTTMRDGMLTQMDPAAREDVWHHVAEARDRIATRAQKG